MKQPNIELRGVRVHNLQGINCILQPGKFIVFTGVSGSGKSSIAFDTIHIEGQRRYIESLSIYMRRQMGNLPKPKADRISGISPTIAVKQSGISKNPRSTVGTITGIYDLLRVLYARVGKAYCPLSNEPVSTQSSHQIIEKALILAKNKPVQILAPYSYDLPLQEEISHLLRQGFVRVRIDKKFYHLADTLHINTNAANSIDLVIDRLQNPGRDKDRLKEAITKALELGNGMCILYLSEREEVLLSTHSYCKSSKVSYPPLEPSDFSFNHPNGMCEQCQGLGEYEEFDLSLVIDPEKSIAEGACSIAGSYDTVKWGNIYRGLAKIYRFSLHTPWKNLSESAKRIFLYGNDQKWTQMTFVHPDTGKSWIEYVSWKGVIHDARTRYSNATFHKYKEHMKKLMNVGTCPACHGSRLRPYPSSAKIGKKTIGELSTLPLDKLAGFFAKLRIKASEKLIVKDLLEEIDRRLTLLLQLHLHYITLHRASNTLSGGELQRIHIIAHLGLGITGATYILDEPSIGLHARDSDRLIGVLHALRNQGNTVLVVEHDEDIIRRADEIIDVGPGAGRFGGEIVAQGSVSDIMHNKRSVTGKYLAMKKQKFPSKKRTFSGRTISILGATHHNLKNIDVTIPLEALTVVTGVSGSGKSSLILDILYPAISNQLHRSHLSIGSHKKIVGIEHIDKIIAIDQSPIGRSSRSNPATYIKLFDDIRSLFAKLPSSLAEGFGKSRFSFNLSDGNCSECKGLGYVSIDMDFLEDQIETCPLCHGKRFDSETLKITYKGKNISDILQMSILDAREFFGSIPTIRRKLELLDKVGLSYIILGQSSATLSGGEAQRMKLAKELVRPDTGKTLYILDEPTTGLHISDIANVVQIIQELVDKKNSVVVIEHHLDFIRAADHVIDLGPDGGDKGGCIVFAGRPESLAKQNTFTGLALKKSHFTSKKQPPPFIPHPPTYVEVTGASQNNLQSVSTKFPIGKITACTGLSGSGKSSFAFDTIYSEGQRRYTSTLSPYMRQFVHQMPPAQVEKISGLSPTIAVEQKKQGGSPRSTLGTMTEIYDYLRLIFCSVGEAYCPESGEKLVSISKEYVRQQILSLPPQTRVIILSEIKLTSSFDNLTARLQRDGFTKMRVNGTYFEIGNEIPWDSKQKNRVQLVIDRFIIKEGIEGRVMSAIELALSKSPGQVLVVTPDKELFFNLAFATPKTGKSYPSLTPRLFSFNNREGMCPVCQGLGYTWGAHLEYNSNFLSLSAVKILQMLWRDYSYADSLISLIVKFLQIPAKNPLKELSSLQLDLFCRGATKPFEYARLGWKWKGINAILEELASNKSVTLSSELLALLQQQVCAACKGSRLGPLPSGVIVNGYTLFQICTSPFSSILSWLGVLKGNSIIAEPVEQIRKRVTILCTLGLDYLTLERTAPTLSHGETSRAMLSKQLATELTGCLYILDEPTVGLHPYNTEMLFTALQKLCYLGNTILFVENDPVMISKANYIIDFGPGSGSRGGKIIAEGSPAEIIKDPQSITGKYIKKSYNPIVKKERSVVRETLNLKGASKNNISNLSLSIPLHCMVCFTGVSGAGKTTLLREILWPLLRRATSKSPQLPPLDPDIGTLSGISSIQSVLYMSSDSIGTTNRADVNTYIDLAPLLRQFFAALPQAQMRNLRPKHFSYNHISGMCMQCYGIGVQTIDLQFLPKVQIPCKGCHGRKLNPLSLTVSYRGKNLGDLLQYRIEEVVSLLPPHPKILRILEILERVGLSYLKLGQPLHTLSTGEAKRLQLAKELAKKSTKHTVYIFDEPSIGMHPADVELLLAIFQDVTVKGHSVWLIEHNLDVIANSDYIIDMGPGSGEMGGKIVATGSPEEIAKAKDSFTGKCLRSS